MSTKEEKAVIEAAQEVVGLLGFWHDLSGQLRISWPVDRDGESSTETTGVVYLLVDALAELQVAEMTSRADIELETAEANFIAAARYLDRLRVSRGLKHLSAEDLPTRLDDGDKGGQQGQGDGDGDAESTHDGSPSVSGR